MAKLNKRKWNKKKLSISGKIILGYCVVSIIAVAIVGWVVLTLTKSSKQVTSFSTVSRQLATVTLPHNNIAYELVDKFTGVGELFETAIANEARGPLDEVRKEVKEIVSSVSRSIPEGSVDAELEAVLVEFNRYAEDGMEFVSKYLSDPENVDLSELSKMSEVISTLKERLGEFRSSRTETLNKELNEIAQSADQMNRQNKGLVRSSMVVSVVGLVIAIFISMTIASRIVRPISNMVDVVKRIAEGDLTASISSDERSDELGILMQGFGNMLENLRSQTQQLIEGANTLATSANEISTTVSQLATSATQTSSSVTEISTTLEEVKQTSHLANEKASHVAKSAETTAQISDQGKEATQEAVTGMSRIKEEMDYIAEGIVQLSEKTQSIGQIIGSVNDLADQSNLLSVNASIEAAKAGELGKGFAVVAQEMKSLADQSKEATDQVSTILNDIQKASSSAVMATERGSKAVTAGVDLSAQAGDTIGTLAENVKESAQAAAQISASSHQQLTGMDQLAQAMESIKDASEQNADSTKQLESQAQSLKELGQSLKELAGGLGSSWESA